MLGILMISCNYVSQIALLLLTLLLLIAHCGSSEDNSSSSSLHNYNEYKYHYYYPIQSEYGRNLKRRRRLADFDAIVPEIRDVNIPSSVKPSYLSPQQQLQQQQQNRLSSRLGAHARPKPGLTVKNGYSSQTGGKQKRTSPQQGQTNALNRLNPVKLEGANIWYDHPEGSSNKNVSSQHGYIWRSKERYFFPDLKAKLREMTNGGGSCSKHIKIISDKSIGVPFSEMISRADFSTSSLVYASSFPPDDDLRSWWSSMQRPKQMRVDPWLCESPYTRQKPIFNNPGCQLSQYMHHSAPRCQSSYLKWICEQSRMDIYEPRTNGFIVPESDHTNSTIPPTPFLISATNVLVSLCGDIVSSCGIVRMTTNCKANEQKWNIERFADKCSLRDVIEFVRSSSSSPSASSSSSSSSSSSNNSSSGGVGAQKEASLRHFKCNEGTPWMNTIEIHDRVFVVAEVDDTYVYHIHLEIMPRIVYHLDFLLRNPDVKILIGCDTKEGNERTEAGIRHGLLSMKPLMDLAGLSMDRLIVHRHIFAKEVFWPMEGGCQDPVYNTWQVLHMRNYFMDIIGYSKSDILAPPTSVSKSTFATAYGGGDSSTGSSGSSGGGVGVNMKKPTILLMKRSSNAKHTRNNRDLVRQWSDDFTAVILNELKQTFPGFNVKLFSDRNVSMMTCHSCQMREFYDSEVVIGMHGAGMANILYMRPNRAVVEIGPYTNDGRILLGGGPFSRAAVVMSHNYMIHHPPYEEFTWIQRGMSSEFNASRFVRHVQSFLKSIDYV